MTNLQTILPAQAGDLTAPGVDEREAMKALLRDRDTHAELMARLSCMNRVEAPPRALSRTVLDFPLTVAAWNLERCLFPKQSAALLKHERANIVLLSEVDDGMARTGQHHTSAEIADALGMAYAFGVEFLELGLGSPKELGFAKDLHNARGFHGNALLAASAIHTPVMIRLDHDGHWFVPESPEHRIGGRCAIAGAVLTMAGPLLAVSVHLESNANAAFRERQMNVLFDAVDTLAAGFPVIVGGDLNTGLADDGDFEKEGLFARAADRGYARHGGPLDAMTTRASLISTAPKHGWKLDWFLTRGLMVTGSRIVPALAPDETPLSDHELMICEIAGFE